MRALIVTYQFPPTGGAGVGRALKLCKYLPDQGVEPVILTPTNPSVPVEDRTAHRDVPVGTRVISARTLEPPYAVKRAAWSTHPAPGPSSRPSLVARAVRAGIAIGRSLLVPDPQVLWQPAAQRALARALRQERPDLVFITAPPFSQFLLAPLARARGVPVVLDYRDEWTTCRDTYEMFGPVQRAVGQRLEAALLRRADAVTVATEAFRDHLLRQFSFLAPERVRTIPNGYDPDDFPAPLPEPPGGHFRLTYAGTIFRLTRPTGLIEAIRRLHRDEPELAGSLRVRFLGRIVDSEADLFRDAERLGIECRGYVDKSAALAEQAASHMVLCLLADMPETTRILPAKVFELMHLRRPCLTVAPEGILTDLVRRHRLGPVAPPGDPAAIARVLERALRDHRAGTHQPLTRPTDTERYHRRVLAGEFANLFRTVLAGDAHWPGAKEAA